MVEQSNLCYLCKQIQLPRILFITVLVYCHIPVLPNAFRSRSPTDLPTNSKFLFLDHTRTLSQRPLSDVTSSFSSKIGRPYLLLNKEYDAHIRQILHSGIVCHTSCSHSCSVFVYVHNISNKRTGQPKTTNRLHVGPT